MSILGTLIAAVAAKSIVKTVVKKDEKSEEATAGYIDSKSREVDTESSVIRQQVQQQAFNDSIDNLKKIKDLYDAGIISSREYEKQKKALLKQIKNNY